MSGACQHEDSPAETSMVVQGVRQLASESIVYGLSGAISRFLSVLLVPVYTRIFSPEDYGVMSLVSTTMMLVSIFVVLALDSSAHRWYWDSDQTEDRKSTLASWAWCQIVVSVVFALFVGLASDMLGQTIVGRGDAGLYFRIAAMALPLSVLGGVITNWLRMQRRAWATVAYSLGISVFNILMTLLLVVVLHRGLAGVYGAQLATALVGTAVSALLLRDWVHPRYFRRDRLQEMLRYALPLIPSAIALWVVDLSGRYFVQYYDATSEVGLYQVASSVAAVVALLTSAFQLAWGPFAMSIHKQAQARDVYAAALLAYAWLTCMVGTGLSLLAPEAIRLVATEAYLGASTAVAYLAFGYIMVGLGYIAALGPSLAKTTRPIGVAITCAALLNLGLNLVLVPRMGKEGAALSTLLSQAVVPVYVFYRSQQLYHIHYRFGPVLSIFVFSFALVFLGHGWQPASLVVGIAAKLALLSLFVPAAFVLRLVTLNQAKATLLDTLGR